MQALVSFEVGYPMLFSRGGENRIFAAEVSAYIEQRLVRKAGVLFLVADGTASVLGSHFEDVRNAKLPASQKSFVEWLREENDRYNAGQGIMAFMYEGHQYRYLSYLTSAFIAKQDPSLKMGISYLDSDTGRHVCVALDPLPVTP
ncbi:hypothetical protein CXF92_00390 [Pseudomonas sp. Choline-3u-10]|uniref:hypothetical protein n=1 Tax=Pseudomonas sp. Choline-3u-10 TaxID=2058311 RepID=UPI000C3278ED|nr:hypothetical protein [Pseudomonas sp. Choline-3u-10]PKG96293.1 hypothetical protein CXF92_00390 [Pseudomonas sp. Choline-3u-10]